jgi:hypothetical protein
MMAERFSQRPSTIIGIRSPLIAYLVDDALHLLLVLQSHKAKTTTEPAPPGLVYEDLGELARQVREREARLN